MVTRTVEWTPKGWELSENYLADLGHSNLSRTAKAPNAADHNFLRLRGIGVVWRDCGRGEGFRGTFIFATGRLLHDSRAV